VLEAAVDFHKEVRMSDASRATKMESGSTINRETSRETVEVTEAIKALQMQLADLRKIIQAAKSPDEITEPGRRQ
jgi:predicted phage tail protein